MDKNKLQQRMYQGDESCVDPYSLQRIDTFQKISDNVSDETVFLIGGGILIDDVPAKIECFNILSACTGGFMPFIGGFVSDENISEMRGKKSKIKAMRSIYKAGMLGVSAGRSIGLVEHLVNARLKKNQIPINPFVDRFKETLDSNGVISHILTDKNAGVVSDVLEGKRGKEFIHQINEPLARRKKIKKIRSLMQMYPHKRFVGGGDTSSEILAFLEAGIKPEDIWIIPGGWNSVPGQTMTVISYMHEESKKTGTESKYCNWYAQYIPRLGPYLDKQVLNGIVSDTEKNL